MSPSSFARPVAASPLAISAVAASERGLTRGRHVAARVGDGEVPLGQPPGSGVLGLRHQPLDGVGHRPIAPLDELVLEQVTALHELIGRRDHEPLVVCELADQAPAQAELDRR